MCESKFLSSLILPQYQKLVAFFLPDGDKRIHHAGNQDHGKKTEKNGIRIRLDNDTSKFFQCHSSFNKLGQQ